MKDNFEIPQRQSPLALAIIFFRVLRTILMQVWPFAITILLGNKEKMENRWLFFAAGVVILVSLMTMLNYFFFRFSVQAGQLVVKKGIITKENITIPLARIQAVHLEQSLLHTLTGTYKVMMDTAGTGEAEVEIFALNNRDALLLRELILQQEKDIPETANRYNELNGEEVSHLPLPGLLKLSLSANHIETMAVILAFLFSRYEDFKPLIRKTKFLHDLETYGEQAAFTWRLFFGILIIALIFTIIVSFVRTGLKYYDYTVRKNKRGFHIQWGLLQVKQKMVPFRKIQLVSWKSNFLRRKIGLWLLSLKAAGENAASAKFRIQVPVTAREQIDAIASRYQPQFPSLSGTAPMGISSAYAFRRVLLLTTPVVLVIGVILYFFFGWNALWVLLLIPYSYISSLIFARNFRYWVTEEGLQLYKGAWGREEALLNWEKIQYVSVEQSIYQRKKGLANLVLETAGGSFTLPYIWHKEASQLMDYASFRVASSQKLWL